MFGFIKTNNLFVCELGFVDNRLLHTRDFSRE